MKTAATAFFPDLIRDAPRSPGVYLMKDAAGEILYAGKAKDLQARLRNYAGGADTRGMIPFLLSRVRDVEWILTATEKEALILENNIIKEHRPRYNVDFRDDKAYFHIRMDTAAPFPRWQLVRRPKNDGARYFGPYPSSGAAKETLRFLQTVFPLRTCRDVEFRSRRRPCLEYQIGRCLAPCVQLVAEERYLRLVRDALTFLEGDAATLLRNLEDRMEKAAAALQFEEAAALRDRIGAIRTTLQSQQAALPTAKDQDVFGTAREEDWTQLCLLRVRAGKMVGMQTFPPLRSGLPAEEILTAAVTQFYDAGHQIPGEILVPVAGGDRLVLEEWLGEKRGRRVRILVPQRGRGRSLVEMAGRNAAAALQLARQRRAPGEELNALAAALGLRKPPERMECVDISNLGGSYAVGSLVTFIGGEPCRSGYRRFRIRTVSGADDCRMMYEVLTRRFAGGENLPDLLVVDGGRGQLAAALTALRDLDIRGVEVAALAKERDVFPKGGRRKGGAPDPRRPGLFGAGAERASPPKEEAAPEGVRYRLAVSSPAEVLTSAGETAGAAPGGGERANRGKVGDRIYLPGRKDAVPLSRYPAALLLLQRLRDEAHRFALDYHRKVREKENFSSPLDAVPGLGVEKKKALLKGMGDLERIRAATVGELKQIKGIGSRLAIKIRAHFDAVEDGGGT
ncbi:MAG TPA: excinuclease ABC subunit UvrC [Syntrophales bacterium]|nr:excinuclease ABC subunit UvrC [Syntrophales bacterium]HQJ30064.1 excinuclease ABC subunit UvrC [Syntrophales bacterium]